MNFNDALLPTMHLSKKWLNTKVINRELCALHTFTADKRPVFYVFV